MGMELGETNAHKGNSDDKPMVDARISAVHELTLCVLCDCASRDSWREAPKRKLEMSEERIGKTWPWKLWENMKMEFGMMRRDDENEMRGCYIE
jgi:hypothetical protein